MKRLKTRWLVWLEVTTNWQHIQVNACGLGVKFDSKRDAMRVAKDAAGQARDDERISVVPWQSDTGIQWTRKEVIFSGERFLMPETVTSRNT